jgi:uncharacterized protein YndB with AHSA1/START domain
MKILKVLLYIVVALVLIIGVGGMFLPSQIALQRSAQINATPDKIYPLIAAPKAWKDWSAWNKRDPVMEIVYSGPESGNGATWDWKSKSQGNGHMAFKDAAPPEKIGYDIAFPDYGAAYSGEFILEAKDGGTYVTWTLHGDVGKNPINRWMGLFMDKLVGPDFEAGLAGLKTLAEKS